MNQPRFTILAALLHRQSDRIRMSDTPYEVFLKGKEATLMAELASVRATLSDLARLSGKPSEQPAGETTVAAGSGKGTSSKKSSRDKSKQYSGLTVSDALVEVLEASAIPMSTGQIWAALQKEGIEPISDDSLKAITWALRKRARNHNDVVRVSYGKWALRRWYTETQLRKIAKSNTGRGSLSSEEHGARTKAGIESRRAAGLKVGARSIMTPERRAEVERLIRAGYSISGAAKGAGIAPGTIYNNYSRDEIAKLRSDGAAAGEQEDSQQEDAGEEPGRLRVVK